MAIYYVSSCCTLVHLFSEITIWKKGFYYFFLLDVSRFLDSLFVSHVFSEIVFCTHLMVVIIRVEVLFASWFWFLNWPEVLGTQSMLVPTIAFLCNIFWSTCDIVRILDVPNIVLWFFEGAYWVLVMCWIFGKAIIVWILDMPNIQSSWGAESFLQVYYLGDT